MSKKKQNKAQPKPQLSPEKYIQTKARNLPIEKCLINKDWQEAGVASIVVVRQHKSGNRTLGIFLVDLYCLGIKDAFYYFNIDPIDYEEIEDRFFDSVEIAYNEVHNIIYGGMAYAEELGIEPVKGFSLAQYILEEDTEEIPLIEYEFGRNGKPFLFAKSQLQASQYIPILEKSVGVGNFEYTIGLDDDDDEYDDEYYDDEELFSRRNLVFTDYNYQYPDYPTELVYKHHELDLLFDPEMLKLEKETIDKILAIDRDELLADLENILLYEIGRTCDDISDECWEEPPTYLVIHILFIFGELRATEKLNLVLEVLRQNRQFKDFHFAGWSEKVIPLTLYYVTGNQLDTLFEYMEEPSLEPHLRIFAVESMICALEDKPEKREEVIAWLRKLLVFYLENISNTEVFDSTLLGTIMYSLIVIKAKELLPEIEALYNTRLVDVDMCGDYEEMEGNILFGNTSFLYRYKPMNIYDRYENLLK
ncbi:DUF1186 domain-containing protein [Bacteroides sp. 519]|uniref:DUF1186 domain-containing protein n=1 Tax=Bacteroides sp. 519 TaxID=2302937 RepID=UPI0013D7BAFE|nr:DUF1186 domain-containing protein [Bacteroides sp. 519]NDV60300.1 DUF1186 domain-containing protein [Bacteroides sp. 519]